MTDILTDLRAKASQCSQATPFVRVTGDLLDRAIREIEALRKADEARLKQELFEREAQR
jgi:hypothetical protein